MKRLKYFISILVVIISMTTAFADTTLLSMKKGGKGDQVWVVLTFSQKVIWSGISKTGTGKYTLYFLGNTGDLDGVTKGADTISGAGQVTIAQISTSPSIMKASIVCADNAQLSVVTNNNYMVIAFNNDRFLKDSMSSPGGDFSPTPGSLKNVSVSVKGDSHFSELNFEGSFEWYGFSRPAAGVAAVLVRNADNQADKQYDFTDSDLNQIKIFNNENGSRGIKTALFFSNDLAYSIVRKGSQMVIETNWYGNDQLSNNKSFEQFSNKAESRSKTNVHKNQQDDRIALSDLIATEPSPPKQTVKSAAKQTVKKPLTKRSIVKQQSNKRASAVPTNRQVNLPVNKVQGINWNDIVSFRFNKVPIKTALDIVASSNNLNIVVDDSTTGLVSMNLKNVTLRQAMDKIVHPHGCEYFVDDGIVMIKPVRINYPGGLVTRIFRLQYAEADNLLPVIGQIVKDSSRVKVYYDDFLNHKSGGAMREKYNKKTIQGTRRSSTLVVTERPIIMKEVVRVIAVLDVQPVQFIIKSKLVEMAPKNANKLGVNWDKTIALALEQVSTLRNGKVTNSSEFNVNTPSNNGAMNLGHLTASRFSAILDFLDERTETNLKSNPSILTMDNQEGSISVGTTVPIPKIQRGTGGRGDMVTFEYKEVNIQLNVTPHLTSDNKITMFVNPVIEEISGWVELDRNRAPITDKRQVNSIVTIGNGETVVIGGLVKTQEKKIIKKVWFLGSIPLIGKLFQHEVYEEKQTDLLIFITPEIVNPEM